MTRLNEAAFKGDVALVQEYLEAGDNPVEKSTINENYIELTPLHAVLAGALVHQEVSISKRLRIAQSLIKFGAEANILDGEDKSPLHWAAKLHFFEFFKLLLENKADVNAQDKLMNTPLHSACALDLGYLEEDTERTLTILVNAGADLNAINLEKDRPVEVLKQGKHPELSIFLTLGEKIRFNRENSFFREEVKESETPSVMPASITP